MYAMSATRGDDAGGGPITTERTTIMAAPDFTVVHGVGTMVGIAAGVDGECNAHQL